MTPSEQHPGGPGAAKLDKERKRIIGGIRRWCDRTRLLLNTAAEWNRQHPDEEPIDIDPGGQLRQMLAEAEEMLARDPGHGPIAPFQYVVGREHRRPQ